ncbi:glycosyltransferase [Microbacterium bovistercoris]|uniref:Glycosyltransferase n=1 Tax=Microbacterium bovistercoris TaxID=2293570 RepID=A0A371NXJ7_9MICO|nr:glycosyltransferase [Microbacterium bovistercoris]REJ08024.1 glycosyltransferase [Microbacterium bovistercoris]
MTDLVVVSLEAWDEVWRRNQYLVSGLLDADPDLRALFVEPPDDPLHAVRSGSRPRFGHGLRQVADRLWTFRSVKALPRRLDAGADERMARAALRAAQQLGMTDPVLWINDPGAAAVARGSGLRTFYDMTDDWIAADRPVAERERLDAGERWLLATADTVIACSPELVRRKRDQRADIVLVRNAVDVARYREPTPRPADVPAGPYALYVGTLHRDRLDVELCVQTAQGLGSGGRLVLVGPNALSSEDSARLRESGAVLLGARPRDAVPGYLQHAAVLLVPHRVTAFTESLDPLKLYEYQAVGRPVVSTPVAGFRDSGDPRVVVAEGSAFSDAVRAVVAEPVEAPIADQTWVAEPVEASSLSADWSDRVAQVRTLLEG